MTLLPWPALRALTAFSKESVDLSQLDWEALVPFLIAHGVAPLAAYNLEYRLGDCGAPEWAVHHLLSIYQGTANDNVMKLWSMKRVLAPLEGRRLVLLGALSSIEALYPHLAFRPLPEVRLTVAPRDVEPLSGYLQRMGLSLEASLRDDAGAEHAFSDTRTIVFLHERLSANPTADAALRERSVPLPVFGPSAHRLTSEDAVLFQVWLFARSGFAMPLIEHVDLRELLLGAPSLGGAYSTPPDASTVLARARELGLTRALFVAMQLQTLFFPEVASTAAALTPKLGSFSRGILQKNFVEGGLQFERARPSWAARRLIGPVGRFGVWNSP